MLFVVFTADGNRYALPVGCVREITPVVVFREFPGAPEYVRGIMNYRGEVAPVIDLTVLLAGRPSRRLLSTRIIVTGHAGADGQVHALGLVAEQVTDTAMAAPGDVQPPGIEVESAPYLTGLILDRQGLVQVVDPARILPKSLRENLFRAAPEAPEATDAP
jgi:chemotaxis-related protein WspB